MSDRVALSEPVTTPDMVSLSHLTYRYNGSRRSVIENLSLDIPTATTTAILGPNGSGKTTLLRLLVGVLRPQEGEIRFAGRPQGSFSRREMSQLVGLVPQDEHIPFDFSILEYVLLGRAPYLGPLAMPAEADYWPGEPAGSAPAQAEWWRAPTSCRCPCPGPAAAHPLDGRASRSSRSE
jgi:ABC-type molybdenum transport system ATPase subunit/photorepair protein PhrA